MFASTWSRAVLGGVLGLVAAGAAAADDKKDDKPVELNVGDAAPTF